MFSLHHAEKEDIWAFFSVLVGQIIFCSKGGHVLQEEDLCKPIAVKSAQLNKRDLEFNTDDISRLSS